MKIKHLLVTAFSMVFIIIILISNTCLAFAVVIIHTPKYNAGYTAACNDVKHGIEIWDQEGSIWDGFYQKYPSSLTNNTQWFQGYRDGAICTHIHAPQYNAGFIAACNDKKTGLLKFADTLQFGFPPHYFDRYPESVWNNTHWLEGYTDGATTTCP